MLKDYAKDQNMPLFRLLDDVGDGSGVKNAVGDYSTTAKKFIIKPAVNQKFFLARMMIHITDGGALDSGSYGNGITLTNGIEIKVTDSQGYKIDITEGIPILKNPDWARLCYDMNRSNYGTGDETLNARFTFLKSGVYLVLDGNKGEQFEVDLNDDFSGLVEHYFQVQGFIVGLRQ